MDPTRETLSVTEPAAQLSFTYALHTGPDDQDSSEQCIMVIDLAREDLDDE
jgi:hypothetical protein